MPHLALYSDQMTLLRQYRALIQAQLARVAKETGMHVTDVAALNHILDAYKMGRVLSPGELGLLLSLSGPATTALLDRLERGKYIVRQQSTEDGRRIEIHVAESFETQPGKSIFAGIGNIMRSVFSNHTLAEVAMFTSILGEIDAALEEDLKTSFPH